MLREPQDLETPLALRSVWIQPALPSSRLVLPSCECRKKSLNNSIYVYIHIHVYIYIYVYICSELQASLAFRCSLANRNIVRLCVLHGMC